MTSDELIVGAVLQCGTAAEAAKMLGVDPSTIYRRMRTGSAPALYRSIQADFLRQTVDELSDARDDALTVIRDIMSDCDVNPAIRLQAAQAVLSNDMRYAERLSQVEDRAKNAYDGSDAEVIAKDLFSGFWSDIKKQKKLEKQLQEKKKGF